MATKKPHTTRKEMTIGNDSLQVLQKEASRKGWTVNEYMKWVLCRQADRVFKKQK